MSYELGFRSEALKEWSRRDGGIREPFKKKRAERLVNPRIPSAELAGHGDRYKIDQRSVGSRPVY